MNPLHNLIVQTVKILPKSLIYLFAKKYIAGKTLSEGVAAAKKLNSRGILATMDVLGESVSKKEDAINFVNEFLELLDTIEHEKINANISTKPTQFGLNIDFDFCYEQYEKIIERAKKYNNFVRIDMEDSSTTDSIIKLYTKLYEKYPQNVGIVVQAYLHRTLEDVRDMDKIGTNYRLCKGIYIEPKEIAYKGKDEVRNNFIDTLNQMFDDGCYVGIATHDKPIVDKAYEIIKKRNLSKDKYEFQMLFGVTENLRQQILESGHTMRVYVPFGNQWYFYATRRLQENPQVAWTIFKSFLPFTD
ncbi:MAG: proline dehydrogenase family protein [Bacteroidetes bacterium]|nr:proline dehydrogenase family protein [Bacteroidota bacterium]MBU1115276.1 proline dehydrogenase family protein [Bacteroidota bacterium]MBU1799243.1 proline dehydrogenase family protein [Bacteroidota bacterium]